MPATVITGWVISAQIAHLDCIIEAQKIISYTFRNPGYLYEALQAPGSGVITIEGRYIERGNECLAIVGDRALGTVMSKNWFATGRAIKGVSYLTIHWKEAGHSLRLHRPCPQANCMAGQWTKDWHDCHLSDANLARVCKQLGPWQCRQENRFHPGQSAADKAYATLLEAVVGAVFLDAEDGWMRLRLSWWPWVCSCESAFQ